MTKRNPGIVWLASYPRSGNTWLRIFLLRLLSRIGQPVDIDAIASHRATFDEIAGIESSEFMPEDIDLLRPRVYETIAARNKSASYIKVHDAYLCTPAGEPLMPVSATRAAIYIVRNPLDIAVSLTFFNGHRDFDLTIAQMADPGHIISLKPGKLSAQLHQRLSTWSRHATSWIDLTDFNCHLMRYEEMVHSPLETFTAAARFLGLPYDVPAIQDAIESARFDTLREAEEQHGFVEKPTETERFFRAGRVGGWRDHLSAAQASKIVADHRTVMERFGYLNPDGSPKF